MKDIFKNIYFSTQDVNYIQQNTTTTTNTLESDCTPSLTHATRVSPATVSLYAIEVEMSHKLNKQDFSIISVSFGLFLQAELLKRIFFFFNYLNFN